jgi:hypothetical protein
MYARLARILSLTLRKYLRQGVRSISRFRQPVPTNICDRRQRHKGFDTSVTDEIRYRIAVIAIVIFTVIVIVAVTVTVNADDRGAGEEGIGGFEAGSNRISSTQEIRDQNAPAQTA